VVLAAGRTGAHHGCGPVAVALLLADVAPATAVGDLAELLHIHVQQVPGMVVLVATDRLAGGPVHMGEPVEPAADQHRVHRRGRQAQPVGDLDRAEPLLPPQVHDLPDGRGRGPVRLMVRTRGPVGHPGRPLLAVPGRPLRGGLPGHVVTLRGPRRRPAVLDDQPRQPQPGTRGQGSVGMGSVGHEDLLVVERFLRQLHSTSGGLHPSTTSDRVVARSRPTCLGITPRPGAASAGTRSPYRRYVTFLRFTPVSPGCSRAPRGYASSAEGRRPKPEGTTQ
jgi:hypothetical protein